MTLDNSKLIKASQDRFLNDEVKQFVLQQMARSRNEFTNIQWFKHKSKLGFLNCTNTFFLTMSVQEPDEKELEFYRTCTDEDDPKFIALSEKYNKWSPDKSHSMAFHISEWDEFDVPDGGENMYPALNEVSLKDWYTKEMIWGYEEEVTKSVNLDNVVGGLFK